MNKRIKKKLEKRRNYFHYSDYHLFLKALDASVKNFLVQEVLQCLELFTAVNT